MRTGTIVKLKSDHQKNVSGTRGICYDKSDYGVYSMVIFENGEYDSFTQDEQLNLLTPVNINMELTGYKYVDIFKTLDDYRDGVFDEALGIGETSKL